MKIADLLALEHNKSAELAVSVLDLELLLAHALCVEREYLLAHSTDEVSKDIEKLFYSYLERRMFGESIAYIKREKEFFGLDFYVDERVLVPRPETELLIEEAINFGKKDLRKKYRVLDVGTGSGNISVALAKWFFDSGISAEIYALDVSEEALQVARINVEQHGMDDVIFLFQSDLLEVLEDGEQFDMIVANLPYIADSDSGIDKNVKKYEPHKALFGGQDGLELYKKLFQQIEKKKINFGILIGEIGPDQAEMLGGILDKYFVQKWKISKDLEDRDRMFIIES